MERSIPFEAPDQLEAIAALESFGIEYTLLYHEPASTMELCRGIGEQLGARHCKNLFLANKRGDRFFLLLMDPDKPYRTSEVSRRLGSTRLSFGSPEQLKSVLGLVPGCVSVMGLVTKQGRAAAGEGRLRAAIDRSLLDWERVCIHPNVDTASAVIAGKDLLRLLELTGVPFDIIEV